jgi:protein-S-isoprenylcysteine O-methyltransferase Ste14
MPPPAATVTAEMLPYAAILGFVVFCGTILFTAAGRIDLPFLWAMLGIVGASMLATMLAIDPELRRERMRPGAGGVSRAFRLTMAPIILGSWIIAGLDVGRFHWSDTVPMAVQIAAIAALPCAMAGAAWAMRANRFFSPVIRIRSERGHHVIRSGPYRFVRHPGYVANVIAFFLGTLILGSWIATALAIPYAALFPARTMLEERFLRENLVGYPEYATAVPARWVPGVW